MAKITYLFGAGASCQILPLTHQIPQRLLEFKDSISKFIPDVNIPGWRCPDKEPEKPSDVASEFLSKIGLLSDQTYNHQSIDTYAKKLWITKKSLSDLFMLKAILNAFFIYEQLINPVDKRYDSFIASLINRRKKFPSDLRILTWNYDFQFEKTYSLYDPGFEKLEDIRDHLRSQVSDENPDKIYQLILNLNGSTGFFSPAHGHGGDWVDSLSAEPSVGLINILIWIYYHMTRCPQFYQSILNFAWSKLKINQSIILSIMQ